MTIINFISSDDAQSWLWHHDYVMVEDNDIAITYESPFGVRAVITKAQNHKIEVTVNEDRVVA